MLVLGTTVEELVLECTLCTVNIMEFLRLGGRLEKKWIKYLGVALAPEFCADG